MKQMNWGLVYTKLLESRSLQLWIDATANTISFFVEGAPFHENKKKQKNKLPVPALVPIVTNTLGREIKSPIINDESHPSIHLPVKALFVYIVHAINFMFIIL